MPAFCVAAPNSALTQSPNFTPLDSATLNAALDALDLRHATELQTALDTAAGKMLAEYFERLARGVGEYSTWYYDERPEPDEADAKFAEMSKDVLRGLDADYKRIVKFEFERALRGVADELGAVSGALADAFVGEDAATGANAAAQIDLGAMLAFWLADFAAMRESGSEIFADAAIAAAAGAVDEVLTESEIFAAVREDVRTALESANATANASANATNQVWALVQGVLDGIYPSMAEGSFSSQFFELARLIAQDQAVDKVLEGGPRALRAVNNALARRGGGLGGARLGGARLGGAKFGGTAIRALRFAGVAGSVAARGAAAGGRAVAGAVARRALPSLGAVCGPATPLCSAVLWFLSMIPLNAADEMMNREDFENNLREQIAENGVQLTAQLEAANFHVVAALAIALADARGEILATANERTNAQLARANDEIGAAKARTRLINDELDAANARTKRTNAELDAANAQLTNAQGELDAARRGGRNALWLAAVAVICAFFIGRRVGRRVAR